MKIKFILYLLLIFLVACIQKKQQKQPSYKFKKAPQFKLKAIDGKTYSLKDFKTDIVIIAFLANHCPTSQAYEDRIKKLVEDYKDKGVSLIAISSNHPDALRQDEKRFSIYEDDFEGMKKHAKKYAFNFPYLYDGETQKIAKDYGAKATPHIYILDKKRNIRYEGAFDDKENPKKTTKHYVINVLNKLLKEKTYGSFPFQKTKVFGCSIKWKYKIKQVKEKNTQLDKRPVHLQKINLRDFKKKLKNLKKGFSLVNVWATWCPPCIEELPALVSLHRVFEQRKFKLLTVSFDKEKDFSKALAMLKNKNVAAHNLLYTGDKESFANFLSLKWSGALPFSVLYYNGKKLYSQEGILDIDKVTEIIVNKLGRFFFKP